MGSVFKKTIGAIDAANARDASQFIILSRDVTPWKAEHLFAVTKYAPGTKMKHLTGNYRTKVFEGPFSDARKWCEELKKIGSHDPNKKNDRFFFYTTCPKCAKHYGKNYVVGLAAV